MFCAYSLTVVLNGTKKDTAILRLMKADERFLKRNKFALNLVAQASDQVPVPLNLSLTIYCSHPFLTFEKDSLRLFEDSLIVKPQKIEFKDEARQELNVYYAWKEYRNYKLALPAHCMDGYLRA
jgi:hypothetical protein